ncbi:hypothetical protein SCARR_03480 [Pontiella sulfatireligans]|uniref:Uncharacterized protein n=2 Tax=Pontiella sulfatireligans TaxID=2750658 RepID=A0A6C2UQ18_9BACT|nr:hypothetical protein SCARR_03480 [Pontiella sulfatireligans]
MLPLLCVQLLAASPSGTQVASNTTALEYGWSFACCIKTDAKDKAKCQEKIAVAYLSDGLPAEAHDLAQQIEGWRRGVLHADLAAYYAEHGNDVEALKSLARAKLDLRTESEWRKERIEQHIELAQAYMGMLPDAEATGGKPNEWLQIYAELSSANPESWSNSLAPLLSMNLEVPAEEWEFNIWSTQQYLSLSQHTALDQDARRLVLKKAYESAGLVPGWKSFDFKLQVIRALAPAGEKTNAGEWLDAVAAQLMGLRLPDFVKVPLLIQAAEAATACGRSDAFQDVAGMAEELIETLQAIEQPAALAQLAKAYANAGMKPKSIEGYDRALEIASALENPRPRAMAYVDICLAFDGTEGIALGSFSDRLDTGLKGFNP